MIIKDGRIRTTLTIFLIASSLSLPVAVYASTWSSKTIPALFQDPSQTLTPLDKKRTRTKDKTKTAPCKKVSRTLGETPDTPIDENVIKLRNEQQKGISVDTPKVYDDAMLQQMLRSAELRLASLQLLDQASILARLGAVSGASQQSSGFAFNVQGAPIPQVVTTTKLPTETTTATAQSSETGGSTIGTTTTITAGNTPSSTIGTTNTNTAGTTTSGGLTTVSNLAVQDVQTTRAGFSAPAAVVPAPTVTFPSSFSVASSDILNEQLQLTAEVNGLRLLLSGSLSDYFINTDRQPADPELVKLKTTLGFNIALAPDSRYKDAAAIVEVEVRTCEPASDELPAVTAILPREKTYNVAAIKESNTSIGGGVATQIVGFSGSWVRGHKTHYLVQDQDTIASTFSPTDPNKSGFAWQFRPVLGQSYVKAGLKQTFVQLAFPTLLDAGAGEIGQVTVRTYWQKYDRKKGLLKEIVRGSYREEYHDIDIRSFKEPVEPIGFNESGNFEDVGGGQILVKLPGKYLPGTYVRIGSTLLTDLPRFKQEHLSIKFTSPVLELATRDAFLVARDGREVPLITPCSNKTRITISNPTVTPIDDATSRLKVQVNSGTITQQGSSPKLFFVIGQRVFGDSESPLKYETVDKLTYVSALVPNAIYTPSAKLVVKTLLAPENCISEGLEIGGLKPPSGDRLVPLEQQRKHAKFLVIGNNVNNLRVLLPADAQWGPDLTPPSVAEKMRLLILTNESLKTNKQVFLQRGSERPFLLTIPEFEPKKGVAPKALGSISVGSDEIVIVGEGFSEVEGITYREQPVTSFKIINDQALRISGLAAIGLTLSAGPQRVFLKFKSSAKPVEVDIQVVNNIVSTKP